MPACPSCTFWLLCQLTGIFGRRLMWWVWCSICGVPNHWSFRLSWEMFSECRLSASALISWETSDVVVCIPCCWREQFLAWQSSAKEAVACRSIYPLYIYILKPFISAVSRTYPLHDTIGFGHHGGGVCLNKNWFPKTKKTADIKKKKLQPIKTQKPPAQDCVRKPKICARKPKILSRIERIWTHFSDLPKPRTSHPGNQFGRRPQHRKPVFSGFQADPPETSFVASKPLTEAAMHQRILQTLFCTQPVLYNCARKTYLTKPNQHKF